MYKNMVRHTFNSKAAIRHVCIQQRCKISYLFALNFVQDFESEEVSISYTKNGEDLGVAFTVSKEDLADKVLYPHIIIKNTECQINAGAQVGWIDNSHYRLILKLGKEMQINHRS